MSTKTALYEQHVANQALMTDFAGWKMPLHYGSQLNEHNDVRTHGGVFDVSHMRSIDLLGEDAGTFLRHLLANDVAKLKEDGAALYTVMLNETGGIIDDLIVYRLSPTRYRIVVNAATTAKDLAWIDKQVTNFNVEILPRDDLAMLAIQGPKVFDILTTHFAQNFGDILSSLKRFHAKEHKDWLIAYTGYTGEDGVEIILPKEAAGALFSQLLAKGIKPCGLGARDTLRLEAGLNLYGQDMDESQTPYSSNLAWTVDLKDEARDFVGKDALIKIKQQGSKEKLIGLSLLEKGVLRPGMKVYNQQEQVGVLTSGSFSPTCQVGIGFARVKPGDAAEYFIEMRGKKVPAQVVKLPFVKNGQRNF